ncbi:MAG: hypothetical protein ICV56_00280 [Nitrososphaeraceae archaeon]|nr:hypothetical protein [Nitrososphaeraceae archaeon]
MTSDSREARQEEEVVRILYNKALAIKYMSMSLKKYCYVLIRALEMNPRSN